MLGQIQGQAAAHDGQADDAKLILGHGIHASL